MGIILKFLGGPFGTYAMIAVAVAVALTGSVAYGTYEHLQLKSALTSLESSRRDTEIAVNSSHSKDVTIGKMNEALKKWGEYADEQTAKNKESVDKMLKASYDAFVANQKLHELERKDYALPDCVAYLAIDVAKLCPNTVTGMRNRITSSLDRSAH